MSASLLQDTADVRLPESPILIYIACSLTYGRGVLECNQLFVTKCRAILTNPLTKNTYVATVAEGANNDGTPDATDHYYCADEVTEFSYGGCHHSCKSCVEAYNRRGLTVGPMFNYLTTNPDYEYGNAKYCYECHDGFYQTPLYAFTSASAYAETSDKVAGTCSCTLILYTPITLLSMRS